MRDQTRYGLRRWFTTSRRGITYLGLGTFGGLKHSRGVVIEGAKEVAVSTAADTHKSLTLGSQVHFSDFVRECVHFVWRLGVERRSEIFERPGPSSVACSLR